MEIHTFAVIIPFTKVNVKYLSLLEVILYTDAKYSLRHNIWFEWKFQEKNVNHSLNQ